MTYLNRLFLICLICCSFQISASFARDFKVPPFEGVSLLTSFNIHIRQGNQQKVQMDGNDALLDQLDIYVKNNVLIISMKKSSHGNYGNAKIKGSITLPQLNKVHLAGSGNIYVHAFSNLKDLSFSLTGSGNITTEGDLQLSGKFKGSLAGSGNMQACGQAASARFSISGSGNLKAACMQVSQAHASISGSGDITLHAVNNLSASISGSGDVRYKGQPQIEQKIIGSGNVRPN